MVRLTPDAKALTAIKWLRETACADSTIPQTILKSLCLLQINIGKTRPESRGAEFFLRTFLRWLLGYTCRLSGMMVLCLPFQTVDAISKIPSTGTQAHAPRRSIV
jgi:hypothetical protein